MSEEVDLTNAHPLDICHCGDYRKDHKNGVGPCIFSTGSRGDGHFGSGRCEVFNLTHRYDPTKQEFGNSRNNRRLTSMHGENYEPTFPDNAAR